MAHPTIFFFSSHPSPPAPLFTFLLLPFSQHANSAPNIAEIKRDTAYYADTPLSVNHAIMKGKPLRPDYDSRADNMPQIDYFTSGKEYATPASMGIKGKVGDAAAKGEGIPM